MDILKQYATEREKLEKIPNQEVSNPGTPMVAGDQIGVRTWSLRGGESFPDRDKTIYMF